MATISGFTTTIPGTSMSMPKACSRCGELGTKELSTSASVGGKKTRSTTIPYCEACFARAKDIGNKRTMLGLSIFGLALLVSGFGILVPFLPKAALILVPVALATFIGVVLRNRAGTSIDQPHGAWMTGGNAATTVFFCTNQKWAEAFAVANNTTSVPSTIGDGGAYWLIGLLIAGAASTYVAIACQPSVRVDNAMKEPVQIWVDGKSSIVAQPMKDVGPRPEINLGFGTHKLGWSPVGAKAPSEESAPTRIKWSGKHLYSPNRATCYMLDVSTYGSANDKGIVSGPVELTDLYTFDRVDNWFKRNERSVSTKSSGATRVALLPMESCGKLIEIGATVEVRTKMMSCLKAAYAKDSSEAGSACIREAVKATHWAAGKKVTPSAEDE